MSFLAAIVAAVVALAPSMRGDTRHTVTHLIAELARRQPAATEETRADSLAERVDACKQLRSIFEKHPKQKALFTSAHKRKATRKTRRAGATVGGVRELLARALEIDNFRATYVTTTRVEAKDRAWANDTKSGFADVMRLLGEDITPNGAVETIKLGGVTIRVGEADLALEFSNGSKIDLFGADNLRSFRKKRGNAKHVFWVDEAQDFRFLNEFYKAVVLGSITDTKGECWLSGTPGKDCSDLFYEVTRDDEDAAKGWEVHEVTVVDNPFFGVVVWEGGQWFVLDNSKTQHGPYADETAAEEAAVQIRWDNTAGAHIRENNLSEDDPDVQREWYARWVKADLAYVYPVHVVPKHVLTFAPQRLTENPFVGVDDRFAKHPRWYDHDRAILDLPKKRNGQHQWLFGIGADYGYHPDPFALVALAFCRELPDVYEMFSWKCTRVITDDQGRYQKLLWDTLPNVVALVGDPAGKQDDFEVWRQRLGLPIEEANKAGKATLEAFFADAIRVGHVHYREDSPLLKEHRHLMYLPQKPGKPREVDKHRRAADGIVYGDHCADGARYLYAHIDHYLYRPEDPPPATQEARYALERKSMIDDIERVSARRHAEREAEDDTADLGDDGRYSW